jgi:hypothetical protein
MKEPRFVMMTCVSGQVGCLGIALSFEHAKEAVDEWVQEHRTRDRAYAWIERAEYAVYPAS